MTESQQMAVGTMNSPDSEESDLLDAVIILAKHKKLIVGFTSAMAVLAVAVSLVLPNVYKATAKLMPPQQSQSGAAALLSQLGGVANMAAGVAGLKNPNDLYVGMLQSRTVADNIIARFKLKDVYDTDSLEKARMKLDDNTNVRAGKDGLITIEVEDRDQKLVANLANAYAEELLKLTGVLAVTEAGQRRLFYERQLELAKNNLASAEIKLKGGLDRYGVISVDAESRAVLATVARLRAEASAKEIEISSMRSFVTPENPDFKRATEELKSLRSELSKLENGRKDEADQTASSGQAGLENIKVLRDVKYYQMLYELLAKQYELARLDEAKDAATIQVLDKAVEPERKFKPKRAIIVIVSTMLAFAAAIGWAFLIETRKKMMLVPESAARLTELRSHLRFGSKRP
jgi:tyrosine-protein kinase Etk/Wzc